MSGGIRRGRDDAVDLLNSQASLRRCRTLFESVRGQVIAWPFESDVEVVVAIWDDGDLGQLSGDDVVHKAQVACPMEEPAVDPIYVRELKCRARPPVQMNRPAVKKVSSIWRNEGRCSERRKLAEHPVAAVGERLFGGRSERIYSNPEPVPAGTKKPSGPNFHEVAESGFSARRELEPSGLDVQRVAVDVCTLVNENLVMPTGRKA